VRVLDFGLARGRGVGDDTASKSAPSPVLDVELTAPGVLLGTPAYMAPEVFAGKEPDARADQFSFCVSLWFGLHGERPFAGTSSPEIAAAVTAGTLRPPPTGRDVPTFVRRAVERGLSRDPDQRWPTMRALLAALSGDPRRRRRVIWVGTAILVTATGAFIGAGAHRAAELEDCRREAARVEATWNDARAARARERFAASELPYGADSWERVRPMLEVYAEQWTTAQERVCVAELDDRPFPTAAARACLAERLSALRILVEVFEGAERNDVIEAVGSAATLPAVADCEDEALLRYEERLDVACADPQARATLAERAREANAMDALGRFETALELGQRNVDEAVDLGCVRLAARMRASLGHYLMAAGRTDDAVAALVRAYFDAAGNGDDRVASRAAAFLSELVGRRQARVEEGMLWSQLSETALRRQHDPSPVDRAQLLQQRSSLLRTMGDIDEAIRLAREAVRLTQEALGERSPATGSAVNNLAMMLFQSGDYAGAEPLWRRAVEVTQEVYGPDHPNTARHLQNLAGVYMRGEHEKALAMASQALEVKRKTLAETDSDLASTLTNVGNLEAALGRLEDAETRHREAAEIYRRTLGPGHQDLAVVLRNLALVLHSRNRDEEAARLHEEGLQILESASAKRADLIAETLVDLGDLDRRRGDRERAEERTRRAMEMLEATASPNPRILANAKAQLGVLLFERGRIAESISELEPAVAYHDDNPGFSELEGAKARFWLARSLHARDGFSNRVRDLADAADAGFTAEGGRAGDVSELFAVWRKHAASG
jgi:tetratricopeptide (TPR) repeat protein